MATVIVNFKTVVHKKSSGISTAFPDVCKTPAPPAPFVPIPYPNIAMSSDTAMGTKKVKCDGEPIMIQGANFSKSSGDEAGSMGGMVSMTIKGKAEPTLFSFDVKAEGKPVFRQFDLMIQNKMAGPNTPPFPCVQPPAMAMPGLDQDDDDDDWSLDSLEEAE